jgi:molybdenum storage protein
LTNALYTLSHVQASEGTSSVPSSSKSEVPAKYHADDRGKGWLLVSLVQDETGRLHINTPLMAESLMDKRLLGATETDTVFRALPDLNVIKLGGQSIIDRGQETVFPLIEEIVAAREEHQLLVTTGGGTRSRHAYAIGLDLGMPTGVLAKLGSSVSEQNALMLSMLLAPHGGLKIGHDDLVKLPLYLALGRIPVMHAMPPYGMWEEPPERGRIPPHRTDSGTFLTAEVIGARRCILVKDERGLYTADPKKDPDADFIPEIEVRELLAMDLEDLAVERSMLRALANADTVMEVLIVNGRESGNLTRALAGENPGTRIYRGD